MHKVITNLTNCVADSKFSQTHKIGNNGIYADFRYISSFLLYLYLKKLVNVEADISW